MAETLFPTGSPPPWIRRGGWLLVALGALLLGGCGPRVRVADLDVTASWKTAELPPAKFRLDPELRILVADHHMPQEILRHFETKYGVRIQAEVMRDNEELHERIMVENAGYDLIMPSTYMVQELIREKRLRELNHARIPNLRHVDREYFQLKYDPALEYSIPIYHSTIGLALNAKYASGLPLTWREFGLETEHPLARGRIAAPDEMRSTLGLVLVMMGLSPNSRDPGEIARAGALLVATKQQSGLVLRLARMAPMLADEEVIFAAAWNGDAARALRTNGDVRFMIPRGPAISNLDSVCIPANAPHPATAEFFINFLLVPEITAALTNYSHHGNTSTASRAFVSPVVRNGPGYMTPIANKVVFLEDVNGAEEHYRRAWKMVKEAPVPDIQRVPLPFPRTHTIPAP